MNLDNPPPANDPGVPIDVLAQELATAYRYGVTDAQWQVRAILSKIATARGQRSDDLCVSLDRMRSDVADAIRHVVDVQYGDFTTRIVGAGRTTWARIAADPLDAGRWVAHLCAGAPGGQIDYIGSVAGTSYRDAYEQALPLIDRKPGLIRRYLPIKPPADTRS